MVEDHGTRLSALRERVVRGEYEIDCQAVADAIVRRARELALGWAPLERVLIPREAVGRVSEDEPGRAL
jgi:hypothetical protein